MSNRIDTLFNDKLGNHEIPPPAGAWAKVETNLSKKNKAVIWFRWAAALLVALVATSSVVWLNIKETGNIPSNLTSTAKIKRGTASSKPAIASVVGDKMKTTQPVKNNLGQVGIQLAKKDTASHFEKTQAAEQRQIAIATEPAGRTISSEVQNITPETPAISESKPDGLAIANSVQQKPMVLEYTLELPDSPSADVGQGITISLELKEKKGIQKVLDFARDAKNSEGPFATLRGAKDELFAFNFRKDKTRKK